MITELNRPIAQKGFVTLILDYDFTDYAAGRVLIDGWFQSNIAADSVENLIEKFMNTSWR